VREFVEEIETNQAVLDLSETPIKVFLQQSGLVIQADSFHKFNSIPAFILPQSENISATNGHAFLHV
jgi:hypothetical protein